MVSPYVIAGDVGALPGRLRSLWNGLDTLTQEAYLSRTNNRIDQITGQDGGLMAQTGKSKEYWMDRSTDSIHLPNKPVTNIRSLLIEPMQGQPYNLPIQMTAPGRTISLTGGNTFKFLRNSSLYIPAFDRGPTVFLEDDTVTVVYDCGFSTVPDNVKMAGVLILGATLLSIVDNPSGAFSIAEDSAHVMFGGRSEVLNPNELIAEDLLSTYQIKVSSP